MSVPRTLAQEILVLLDEPSVKQAPVTIGQLSRRLGVSSALTRLCARQLVAEGVVDAVMLDHAGTTTIQALSRVRSAAVVAAAPKPQAPAPSNGAPSDALPSEAGPSEIAVAEAEPSAPSAPGDSHASDAEAPDSPVTAPAAP